MKNLFILILLSSVISGCASNVTLSGRHLSNIDPNVTIDKASSIRVESASKKNTLTNKRYIPNVIQAFKARGFTNVSASTKNPDYKLLINFSAEEENKVQSVPIFRRDRGIPRTVCHQSKNNKNRTCSTHYYYRAPMVSGYRYVNIPTNIYTFKFTLQDKQNNPVLSATSTVVHNDCSQWKVYEFLASDTIEKVSFDNPIDELYSATMPEGYVCQ